MRRLPSNWRMPAHYGGSTWEGYGWGLRGVDGQLRSLATVTQATLVFRRGRPDGDLALELCLGKGLALEGDRIRAIRRVCGLPLEAGSYHWELTAFFSDSATWTPVCRGRVEILQNVPKGAPNEL